MSNKLDEMGWIEIYEESTKRGSKTYPFYNCKHIWSSFYFDKISHTRFYKCIKCGKVKYREFKKESENLFKDIGKCIYI